jgi:GH43 family beta-xylosidase
MIADFFSKTFSNPVYPHSFPDPFILKFRGEYYAYCTGVAPDGKVFNVLRSRDLVNWRETGGAMEKLANDSPFYWAPEITYKNGKFYLYYSVGNETLMEIRVAVSDRPDGGFVDSGHKLTSEEFAIDAHVFEDEGGELYFFYATDFLTHTHVGTGTVADKMVDFFTLEGNPKPITRAKYDWQVYDPNRKEKGGVRWHTVEGPTVLKRKGVYYEMFSGGNWQNLTYGVSFAVADDIDQKEEWRQFSDGEKIFPILRTIPDLIVGPGHNSVIRGLNNRELYCVYHRWTENGRVLAIDRMDFTGGGRIFVHGATHTAQPAPFEPKVLDFFDDFSGEKWETISGEWRAENEQIISGSAGKSELLCKTEARDFLCELWLKAAEPSSGEFGISLRNGERNEFRFLLSPAKNQATTFWTEDGAERSGSFPLYENFDFQAFHLLRVETNDSRVKVSLDGNSLKIERQTNTSAKRIAFTAENCAAAFSGFALTEGFEDLFENTSLEQTNWRKISGGGEMRIENQNLVVASRNKTETIVSKGAAENEYEFTINVRLEEALESDGAFGFYPVFDETQPTPYFSFEKSGERWIMNVKSAQETKRVELPEHFLPEYFHQWRFIKIGGKVCVVLENEILGVFESTDNPSKVALSVRNAVVAFDMVRVTVL